MLSKINTFIVACSKSWWKFLIIFLGQIGTMQILMNITRGFPSLTAGDEPFDMQNSLRPEQIFSQLDGYTEKAFDQYMIFQAVDYLFPLFAGLLLATICAFSLRIASSRFYPIAVKKNLFVLLLVPTVFDWLENLNLLWVISLWPQQSQLAANLAVAAKMGKLSTMGLAFAITGGLLIAAAIVWIGKRFRSNTTPASAKGKSTD